MNSFQLFRIMFFYFLKQHGIVKTIKAIIFLNFRTLKLLKIDVSKEHIVDSNECSLILIPNDKGISQELLVFGTHEPLSTKALKNELREGMTCLDIGANIGYYSTIESMAVGKIGRVIAIEPSPINFSYLKRNMELQKTSNYELHNYAIGDTNDEINFLISEKSNLSRVIEEGDNIPEGSELVKIPLKTLDKFVEEKNLNRLDLIRMDVEGYEFQILNNAKKTIGTYKPIIQIEIHTTILGHNKLKKILLDLKNFGYEVKAFVARELDLQFLGTDKDVLTVSLEELIKKLEVNKLPKNFILLLKSN